MCVCEQGVEGECIYLRETANVCVSVYLCLFSKGSPGSVCVQGEAFVGMGCPTEDQRGHLNAF